jgi:6-pyruvoyltetrahydropterin/6-carboxytetrahydropterin synthase
MEKKDISSRRHEINLAVSFHFSAAHTYYIEHWSREKNREVFGEFYSTIPHGHNYRMIIIVHGTTHENSGMVVNFNELEKRILMMVVDEMDHKFLNKDIEYFTQHVPTTENIVLYVWNKLSGAIEPLQLRSVRVYEDEYLFAECLG